MRDQFANPASATQSRLIGVMGNGVLILLPTPPRYKPELGVTLTQEGKNQSSSVGAGVGVLVGEALGVAVAGDAVDVGVGVGVGDG